MLVDVHVRWHIAVVSILMTGAISVKIMSTIHEAISCGVLAWPTVAIRVWDEVDIVKESFVRPDLEKGLVKRRTTVHVQVAAPALHRVARPRVALRACTAGGVSQVGEGGQERGKGSSGEV